MYIPVTKTMINLVINTNERKAIKEMIEQFAEKYRDACAEMEEEGQDVISSVLVDANIIDTNRNEETCLAAKYLVQMEMHMDVLTQTGVDNAIVMQIAANVIEPNATPYKIKV